MQTNSEFLFLLISLSFICLVMSDDYDYYNYDHTHRKDSDDDYFDLKGDKTSKSTETSTDSYKEITQINQDLKNVHTTSFDQTSPSPIESDELDETKQYSPIEFDFDSLTNCRFLDKNVKLLIDLVLQF